jgi:hypothetical protein
MIFEISERRVRRGRGERQVELDQFNLAQSGELTQANLAVQPGNILVPVSTDYALYGLQSVLKRVKCEETQVVVLHVQLLKRGGSPETDLQPYQLFSAIEQSLFTKVLAIAEKEGKPVRLAVAAANDLWEGILRTAANLQSSTVVVGRSSKMSIADQAREIGLAWERIPEPQPRITLEIFTQSGQERSFYLGPHSPQLTPKEVDLLHRIWLQISDELEGEEIHHHDIIHFALTEIEREISKGAHSDTLRRMREHLHEIQSRRLDS